MALDETRADDGAVFRFWDFIRDRRRRGLPAFDLDDVEQLVAAVREFDEGGD